MRVDFSKRFRKQYHKLPQKTQKQFDGRVELFIRDPADPKLNVHSLKGKYTGYWSINVTGDVRALYVMHGSTVVIFAFIGSHSQLYE